MMLRRLYNALWYPALPLALALSGAGARSDAETRRARLGRGHVANGAAPGNPRIWAHAASVGEVGALRPVLSALFDEYPAAAATITTMTVTGRDAARRAIPRAQAHLLAPLDCRRTLGPFLAAVRPALVLIAETELWPNYFVESHAAGARVAIVNGRISQRALNRYRYVRPLIAEALGCADLVLAQSEADARGFLALGAAPERVKVTGNTKLDPQSLTAPPMRPRLAAFAANRPLLVAGSTAPGEDQIVVDAYRNLLVRFPDLALAIAPRHLERTAEVERILAAARLGYVNASAPADASGPSASVLILDTMGELRALYGRATVAFVGGSMVRGRGGQSLAEPAAASAPALFGPFHDNQRAIADALLAAEAGAIVRDAAEFSRAAALWLDDDAARRAAGGRARAAVERMAGGGVEVTLKHLRTLISAG